MAFDFKKEYKEFYMPKNKPSIVTVTIFSLPRLSVDIDMDYSYAVQLEFARELI